MRLAKLSLCLMLSSCSIEPFVFTAKSGQEVTSLGGSLLTKAAQRDLTITRSDGTVIASRTRALDQTKAASIWGNNQLMNKAVPVLSPLASGAAKAIAP